MPVARATLDFFGAQANARRRTRLLIVSFAVALVLVTAFIYAGMLVLDGTIAPEHAVGPLSGGRPTFVLLRPGLLAATTLAVTSVVGLGGAWHGGQLAADGGEAVARMLGGRRIDAATQEPLERRFVNVAEEMALAAGLTVPALYVLDREPAINALAAGYTPGHSVVAVTRGALEQLDREELQGVVAHELSHVLNHDTRIDLQLMAVVGGLGILSLSGRVLLRQIVYDSGSGTRRKVNPLWPLGLALLVAGAFGTLCGELVRYAVARQREWLADASALQFTRNPDGLAGALRRIASEGSSVSSPFAPEAAHLFFASTSTGLLSGLFSTHPPIEERIRRIAPHLGQAAMPSRARTEGGLELGRPGGTSSPVAAPRPELAIAAAPALEAPTRQPSPPGTTAQAAGLLSRLPTALSSAAREPFGARALACAMLVAGADAGSDAGAGTGSGAARAEQLAYLGRNDVQLRAEVERLAPELDAIGRVERMALLALALPSLDALSAAQGNALAADLRALVAADGKVSPFELAVERIVQRRLVRGAGAPPRPLLRSVEEAGPECLELLANLAWIGGRDATAAQAALDAGVRALGVKEPWRLPPRDRLGLGRLDVALGRLDTATPPVKAAAIAAASATVLADGEVTVEEAELLRAAAAALGIPMPRLTRLSPSSAVTGRTSGESA